MGDVKFTALVLSLLSHPMTDITNQSQQRLPAKGSLGLLVKSALQEATANQSVLVQEMKSICHSAT